MNKIAKISEVTNGAASVVDSSKPFTMSVTIAGVSDLLFHRWNCEEVEAKAKASKNSKSKKEDNVESYVWRNDDGEICIPGEYLRMSMIAAAKFKQDPRSPRKSAADLYKAGIVSLTPLASLGTDKWDYEDKRRVTIQRNGINRTRPAMRVGWTAEFDFMVNTPEYISLPEFLDTLSTAGRLVGVGDFRPTFGRFTIGGHKLT